ncbi:hypothetical protein JGS22_010735 [Streptomyces sp. P38-E01]|uniref:Uncharacterized protein n=1 Tax=Streptomyces tardus TaxID=2780544 RepID=A0A949JPW2_9ACTN|nr:hypothetical protein [Streptomyces tardus]MBU7598075.1 hypothetical protein [Streptomyces tardus]
MPDNFGDYSATNTGPGRQTNNYNQVQPWIQGAALLLVLAGLVLGVVLLPRGSASQRAWYVAILAGCAVLSAMCLWMLLGRGTKTLRSVGAQSLGVVAAMTLSALSYQQLSSHGDVDASVRIDGKPPLTGRDVATVTVIAPETRSHLRLRAELTDHHPAGTCATESTVDVALMVGGTEQKGRSLTLGNAQAGVFDLREVTGQEFRLRAVVEAKKGCELRLGFTETVLHDRSGWLL